MKGLLKQISLLIVSSGNDLVCTALFRALKDNYDIGDIKYLTNFETAAKSAEFADLAIIFPGFPISCTASAINKLTERGIKTLLILGPANKYSIRYFNKLPVHGFVSTLSTFDELITAIKTLTVKNLKYISPQLISSMNDITGDNLFASLSKKEIDVAEMAISGKKCRDIADVLKISPKTVSTYKARIYKKLDVNNDVELLKLALIRDIENTRAITHTSLEES
jgi:two-component system invasion response regulator UvrY